ncbi:MAG: DUF2628 domain-containing protein [Oscillospiraceae bacterium]|nr:DUF2628 domain-containing protein [Oscillospiraceae bacterium]
MENKKICASCGVAFGEADDAVTCEHCGTRYHRYCYNISEQGICRCQYDKQAIYGEPSHTLDVRIGESGESVDKSARCLSCGKAAVPGGRFCPYCGGLTAAPGYSAEEVALIGKAAPEYIRKFEKIRHGGMSWNWWAFLWTPFWCFYRKMYFFGIAAMAVQLLTKQLMGGAAAFFQLIFYIMFGIIADSIYMNRIERLSKKAEGIYGDERADYFRAKGGVSAAAPVLLGIGMLVWAGFAVAMG